MNSHQRRVRKRSHARRWQKSIARVRSTLLGGQQSTATGTLNVLLPLIRKVIPTMIANQIVGVQPMTGSVGQIHTLRTRYAPRPKFTVLSERKRWTITTSVATWYTISCDIEVRNWIMETFPDDENTLWQEDQDQDVFHCAIEIHEKVCNFLKLKWS